MLCESISFQRGLASFYRSRNRNNVTTASSIYESNINTAF